MIKINNIYKDVSKQGLGNRLFQYCWARDLAVKKGYELISDPILGFPTTYEKLNGISTTDNLLITPENTQLFNIFEILNHNGAIIVAGYPQRYQHYAENKENIKKWLYIENEKNYEVADSHDVVINIRLGDYVKLGWDLEMTYYKKVLERETYKNAYIICDEPNHPNLKVLTDMGCKIKDNSSYGKMKFLADFVFVKSSKKTIIANSTFSWWAAFLGEGDVYYPCVKFPWVKNPSYNDIDLRPYNEERYKFVSYE